MQLIYSRAAWVLKSLKACWEQVSRNLQKIGSLYLKTIGLKANRYKNCLLYDAVGGIMAFLTLHEMLPLAFDYAGQKQAVKAVFVGMACMSAR